MSVDKRRWLALAALLALTGCSAARATPTPYVAPTPPPTAKPWTIAATKWTYTPKVALGNSFSITVTVKNTGRTSSAATSFQINGLSNHADLSECKPACSIDGFLGASYATFPGVAPGKSAAYTVLFVTTKLGRISPFICLYDGAPASGDQIECQTGAVVISG